MAGTRPAITASQFVIAGFVPVIPLRIICLCKRWAGQARAANSAFLDAKLAAPFAALINTEKELIERRPLLDQALFV